MLSILTKAFDMVDHAILAAKLAKISTPFLLYLSIMSFVINRTYQLKCNAIAYVFNFKTESAVPQGSHCGPLLFIIMTRDIVTCLENTGVKMLLYADDMKIFNIVNCDVARMEMQQVIDKLTSWSNSNKLKLNLEKTKHITFRLAKVFRY